MGIRLVRGQTIWLVEMWDESRRRWLPTVGASLVKRDAKEKARDWRAKNYGTRFRIWPYSPAWRKVS